MAGIALVLIGLLAARRSSGRMLIWWEIEGQAMKAWRRRLYHLSAAVDRGRLSERFVVDELAKVNYEAHVRTPRGTVGRQCHVLWRRRRDPKRRGSGGGGQAYDGVTPGGNLQVPSILKGKDFAALSDVVTNLWLDKIDKDGFGTFPVEDEMNRRLSELPNTPDEKLR